MAKKTLTPEQAEIKAIKKAKKSENWTKFWAIVLAAVLTFGVVAMGKNQAQTAIDAAKENSANVNTDANTDAENNEDENLLGGDTNAPSVDTDAPSGDTNAPSGDTNAPSGDTNAPSGDTNAPSGDKPAANNGPTKAEVVKIFNEATAKAAKGSYKINRTGKFTKPIDVGSATSTLNGIITGVDPNASLDSVVGGFLGVNKPVEATVTNGKGEGFDGKYMIKAMTLTEDDVQGSKVDGNKYMIQIKKCVTPDENSALAHATNDYITFAQVNESIASAVGSAVKVEESGSQATYSSILFTATIVDGKMTKLEYSYTFSAVLKLKITLASATGTGEAQINNVYSDIKY